MIFNCLKQKYLCGNAFYQYLSTATVALMTVSNGMHYGWSSPSLEKFQLEDSPIKITNSEGSWLAVMTLIGNIFGPIIVSVTSDVLGRRRAILISGPLYFVAWIMIAYAKSLNVLYIVRFVVGVVDSISFISSTMYIAEISEPRIRGLLITSIPIAWNFGILLINIIGSYLSITVAALVSSVFPVISFVTFCWMPESPYGLLMQGNYEAAKRSLQFFRGLIYIDSELDRINSAIKSQMSNSGKFLDLFTVKSNRKAFFIIIILRGAQLLGGGNTILLYTQTIFKEVGGISPAIASIIYVSLQTILCMFSSSIIDKAGRRPLLIISICGSGLTLFIEGTYFLLKSRSYMDMDSYSCVGVIVLLVYVIIFNIGMQTIPILMLGELFPTNIKTFALCATNIYFSLVGVMASKFFQIMKDSYGMYVPFYVFAFCCIVSLILICIKVPETKGKTLEEIQLNLSGKVPCNSNSEDNDLQ